MLRLNILHESLILIIAPGVSLSTPVLISTASFRRSIFTVTGKDMHMFFEQWARQGGHVRFHMSFIFNRKRYYLMLQQIFPINVFLPNYIKY